jgi:hypothetical protein
LLQLVLVIPGWKGDADREESSAIGGKFLGLGGPLSSYSWIDDGGLVGNDGGDTTCSGWRPCDALW